MVLSPVPLFTEFCAWLFPKSRKLRLREGVVLSRAAFQPTSLGGIAVNKANVGDGIPAELFQILKGDAVKVLH